MIKRKHEENVNSIGEYHGENIFNYLRQGAILMDIGCGVVPRHGSLLPGGGRVRLIAVDPLAHAYKKIKPNLPKNLCTGSR